MKNSKAKQFVRRIHETVHEGIALFVLMALVFNLELITDSFTSNILFTIVVIVISSRIGYHVGLFVGTSSATKVHKKPIPESSKTTKKQEPSPKKEQKTEGQISSKATEPILEQQQPVQEVQKSEETSKRDSDGVSRMFEMLNEIKSPEDEEHPSPVPVASEENNDLQEETSESPEPQDEPES